MELLGSMLFSLSSRMTYSWLLMFWQRHWQLANTLLMFWQRHWRLAKTSQISWQRQWRLAIILLMFLRLAIILLMFLRRHWRPNEGTLFSPAPRLATTFLMPWLRRIATGWLWRWLQTAIIKPLRIRSA